jgi:hypothetical protein
VQPTDVDFMGSAQMSHCWVPSRFDNLDGGLVILVKVHLDVDLFYPYVTFIRDHVGDGPIYCVGPETLVISSGHWFVAHHVCYGFP